MAELPPDILALSFEDAMKELERIVRSLEQGTPSLEDAITFYERGTHLKLHCESKLQEAEAKVSRIVTRPDGTVGAEPVEIA
jgi:exodeoxyribonuclease VII small subunit